MIKQFPKSRICVIDVYPLFEDGLREALKFANKFNISINSADGRKIIASYCIKSIEHSYKNHSSPYPKVLCIGSKPKTKHIDVFIKKYFHGIMNNLPFPYCGTIDINSPDLEFAAQTSLNQNTSSQQKYKKLVSRLNLRNVN